MIKRWNIIVSKCDQWTYDWRGTGNLKLSEKLDKKKIDDLTKVYLC